MDDHDTKSDVYEYMLGQIRTGQFRMLHHIINLMVNLMKPTPKTLSAIQRRAPAIFRSAQKNTSASITRRRCGTPKGGAHFRSGMFHGFDFDSTMLRIGSMNMTLHGDENPDISYRDSLAKEAPTLEPTP